MAASSDSKGFYKEPTLHKAFPPFRRFQPPTALQVEAKSFDELIAEVYSRACALRKTEAECQLNMEMLNKTCVQKWKKVKNSVDPNMTVGGIPLLHLIARAGVDRYHAHCGVDPNGNPVHKIMPRNKMLEVLLKDDRIDVNATDHNGCSALNYCHSYSYEEDADSSQEGYMVVLNWIDCRQLFLHGSFMCLDLPVPGGLLLSSDLLELVTRNSCLYDESHVACQWYKKKERDQLKLLVNRCGWEQDRVARTRNYPKQKMEDRTVYRSTLMSAALSLRHGSGVNQLLQEKATMELVQAIWNHPAFDKTRFLHETMCHLSPTSSVPFGQVRMQHAHQFASYVNVQLNAWAWLCMRIEQLHAQGIPVPLTTSPLMRKKLPNILDSEEGDSNSSSSELDFGLASSVGKNLQRQNAQNPIVGEKKLQRQNAQNPIAGGKKLQRQNAQNPIGGKAGAMKGKPMVAAMNKMNKMAAMKGKAAPAPVSSSPESSASPVSSSSGAAAAPPPMKAMAMKAPAESSESVEKSSDLPSDLSEADSVAAGAMKAMGMKAAAMGKKAAPMKAAPMKEASSSSSSAVLGGRGSARSSGRASGKGKMAMAKKMAAMAKKMAAMKAPAMAKKAMKKVSAIKMAAMKAKAPAMAKKMAAPMKKAPAMAKKPAAMKTMKQVKKPMKKGEPSSSGSGNKTYFQQMHEARAAEKASFTYKGKTYVRHTTSTGLVTYKKKA